MSILTVNLKNVWCYTNALMQILKIWIQARKFELLVWTRNLERVTNVNWSFDFLISNFNFLKYVRILTELSYFLLLKQWRNHISLLISYLQYLLVIMCNFIAVQEFIDSALTS